MIQVGSDKQLFIDYGFIASSENIALAVNPPVNRYCRHQGVTIMVFRADLFHPLADFTARVDEMERRLRAVPPAPGFKEVLVPGHLEARAREACRRDGIPISDDIWMELTDLAASMDVSVEGA